MKKLSIGTLSFKRKDGDMDLVEKDRSIIIMKIIEEHKPDFLLCAGHTLDTNEELVNLNKDLQGTDFSTTLLLEVRYDKDVIENGHPLKKILPEYETDTHKMFVISPKKDIQDLGVQYFARSGELNKKKDRKIILAEFESNFKNRKFEVANYKVTALCCGEINILKGRKNIINRSTKVKQDLEQLDIIVNPTHDGMANYGTLNAKRKYFSEKSKCYVSSSNWEIHKKYGKKYICQKQSTSTIHSVWVDGKQQRQERDYSDDYEFRIATIN